jgi:hypothetical protein
VNTSEVDDAGCRVNLPAARGFGPFSGGQLTLIVVTVAIVIGFPTIASAVIPNGNTYNACALKTTGALRVIDTSKSQTCKQTETKLSWSKTGAAGAKGATGARGPSGILGVELVIPSGQAANPATNMVSFESTDPGVYCMRYTGTGQSGALATPWRLNQSESVDRTATVTLGAPADESCSAGGRVDFTVTTRIDGVVAPSWFTVVVV